MFSSDEYFTTRLEAMLQRTLRVASDDQGDVVLFLDDGRLIHLAYGEWDEFILRELKFHEC